MNKSALKHLAQKLNISNQSIVRKAEELLQLVEIRVGSTSLGALNLTGSCCVVMCLDLASSGSGQPVAKTEAMRLSGVNKKIYINGLKTLESMLGLEEPTTIKYLAVKFGCTPAADLARQVLKTYEDTFNGADMDFSGPMFMASSLCAACRVLKIKIDRSKLIEVCSVKRKTFDILMTELEKIATKLLGNKKVVQEKRKSAIADEIEKLCQEDISPQKRPKDENEEETTKSDYEEWKKHIVENARKALKVVKQ